MFFSLAIEVLFYNFKQLDGAYFEPLGRGPLGLFDGDLNSQVIFKGPRAGIALGFSVHLRADKLVIVTSRKEEFRKFGRVKWIQIYVCHGFQILDNGKIDKGRVKGKKLYLSDVRRCEIDLRKEGLFFEDGFNFISLWIRNWDDYYPGTKMKYPAISEIEFYYKGKKVDLGPIEELKKSYVEAFVKEVKWYLSYVPGKIYKRKWVAGIEYKDWDPQEPLYAKDILIRPDGVLEWRIYDRVINSRYITNKFGEDFYYKMLDWEEEHDFKTPEWEGEVTGKGKGRRICRIIEEGKGLWKFDEEGRLWFKIGNKWEHVDYEITAWDERWKERYNVYKVRFVIKNTKLRGVYFGDKGCYEEADTAR